MRFFLAVAVFMACSVSSINAEQIEKKGSFGVVVHQNFVKFSYVITYLSDIYKDNHYAFRLDFENNKGYDILNEIDVKETILKNRKNETFQGILEKKSASSVILLFPKKDDEPLKGKTTLYTVIMGYKLKKAFRL